MIEIHPLGTIGEVQPGCDLVAILSEAVLAADQSIQDADILVVTQKIVSKAENRYVALEGVQPGEEALRLAGITRKDPRLVSNKLMVARPIDPRGKVEGSYLVAVDTVDAGVGETVLIVSGSSARMASGMKDCPVDAAIVGIVDAVEISD